MNEVNEIRKILTSQFSDLFDIKLIRPNIYQVMLPFYYPDGDIYEIFIEKNNGNYIVQDYGLSLMKLSYDTETETDSKKDLIKKIISENQVKYDSGNIYLPSEQDSLIPNLLAIIDTITKITSLNVLNRKLIRNVFYELLESFLSEKFKDYGFERKFIPDAVPFASDYLAPHAITKTKLNTPICIFPIASNDRCDQVTITVQHYLLSNYHPLLIGIYENMEDIFPKKSSKVTNLLDKQFSYLDKNEEFISSYLVERIN
ncbi:MAG: DUF1828 domain-containing protein [Ignavibacteriales bacterium]|nr:DUF1828 domain-containing protein [Ignavibacteriales bacterium]